jgi:hypothetical protein
MVSIAGQKPLILTAAEADLQRADARAEANARLAENQINSSTQARGPSGSLAYIVAALIMVAVGYFLFSSNWNTMMLFPTVSETVPSPDINSTVAPAPAPQVTPPPADAPATNP